MPAPSQTSLCNDALGLLGESQRITTINDGTPLANTFLQAWDAAVDEVLADHPWNFAVKRQDCAVAVGVTVAGSQYDQAFEKPADLLRWLPWNEDHEDYFDGEEEGDYILSNAAAPITVRYIARVTQVAKWSPGFRVALAAKLAAKTAYAITAQRSVESDKQSYYDDVALPKAKRQDGLATGKRARQAQFRSNWLTARQRPFNGVIRG